ncbi:MAG: nucleotide exchange factor GrpE [Bacillota bacterium]|jgi:molecular chaperone GrpE|nr:nucleotide exchange factor GrpE [Eubacteriales bacterium]MDD3537137.1 nucleotide exchange factor GrpE [Eubacteriales bacterium]MDD4286047.1 nucleotide exchange factor GrpE [Eubacteriales bacterium]MDI9492337.1 nucleotide exchange factor GrpE [Bacillota bacterium]NLV69860.1 nucleotide exchange factor GrpE [Clostridiales bacterium]
MSEEKRKKKKTEPETDMPEQLRGEEVEGKEQSEQEEDLQTRYLRLAADFQNFRRRSEKERNDVYAYANEKIVLELLDVIDNFERAMDHSWEAGEARLMEGMAMILKQLLDVMEKNHVEVIDALGKPFDPVYHHAVMTEPSESCEGGSVTKIMKKGYMLNKKVIRPAMVVVAADRAE